MIISASRRTDIPAWHAEWFMERVREGRVEIKNPYNPLQTRLVSLLPEDVESIAFWTRNPLPLMPFLSELDSAGMSYYFLFTITGHGKELEPGIPETGEQLKVFKDLARAIGKDKVIWRFDPIIFSSRLNSKYYSGTFERICYELQGFTESCIISFVEPYRKCMKSLEEIGYISPTSEERFLLLSKMSALAASCGIKIQSCAQESDYTASGVSPGSCIDAQLISRITEKDFLHKSDRNQRIACRCTQSTDIGSYKTCRGGCLYCYAS